jgi:predicted enzyme related to lactoylglutathione lyase
MGERSEYAPGTFSWTDLASPDQEAAKDFYRALFGWESDDQPVDGGYYSLMKLDGKDVAAISSQPEQQRELGAPPAWNSYITVPSADQALERAQELGATVHAPAFDVLDVGRMGVVQDPQGAFFLVWQPKRHIGSALVNAPGALCWNELASSDLDASAAFYGELFGWSVQSFADSPMPYLVIQNEGRGNGGMRPAEPPGTPPHWLVYFGTEDVEQTLERAEQLGAAKVAGPMAIGPGTVAVVRDPQGAVFALYAGRFDP